MRKLFFGMLAIVAMIATSCQQDTDLGVGSVGETVSVSLNVGAPASRAYSDGLTATNLQYAVYDASGTLLPAFTTTNAVINKTAKVELKLVTGNTYSVLFWADNNNAPYTVDFVEKTVTVDYDATSVVCNNEKLDAFFALHTFEVKGAQTEEVELKRPFAQLNIGTNDYALAKDAGYEPTISSVKVTEIYNTLNLWDGAVSNEAVVTYKENTIAKGETFPVDGYKYLAMNYLLVGTQQENIEVEFTYTDGSNAKTRTVGSVPVQRNHRTNLYGSILTSDVAINVEIKPEYDPEDVNLYNVFVDGVSYTDFTAAVAAALEKGKAVEFVQNVAIDADNTITIPAGQTLTLNLNGYTLSGVTDDADKNDDGQITSADNEVMFDVRGVMNVNKGRVTIKHVGDSYANFGWNACGEAFYVAFNGVLNVNEATIENFGGVPMAYAIDLVNASATRCDEAGVHLNVESSTLKSSYIPVRVFNNGAGMNHVTINNSTLEGTSRAFWVHVYSSADNGGKGVKDATLNIDIYNNGNTFIANSEDRLIEYGFTDEINVRPDGTIALKDAEGNVIEGIGQDLEGNYAVTAAAGLDWVAAQVDSGNETFVGKTVKLYNDIDLTGTEWNPIGDNRDDDTYFKGTFDGQNHTIKGASKSSFDGSNYGSKEGWGIFSVVEGATIKNLNIDNAVFGSYTVISGAVAAYASDTTFENINITNTKVAGYNWYTGGVVGWAANKCTFKGINLDSSVSVGTLWDSHGQNAGGIAGGISSSAEITIEDCTISCVLDVINDVTSNYKWYIYRVAGMIIGNTNTTETKYNEVVTATATNVTCKNVTVNYGQWMNYHYCQGYWNRGWGRVESSDYVGGVDHTQCNHPEGEEHCVCIPFDQLFGGSSNGSGHYPVKGLREFPGVTVNYPAEYKCPTCGQQHNVK